MDPTGADPVAGTDAKESPSPTGSGDGAPTADPSNRADWNDPERVLRELDRMDADLKPRRGDPSPAAPAPARSSAASAAPYSEDAVPVDAEFSPYLEERLGLASASLVHLGAGLRAIDGQWRDLQVAADRLGQEMEEAAQEIEYLRARAEGASTGVAARGPLISASETLAARAASRETPVDAPYSQFTADRYRKTIGSVRMRRRAIAAWTIGLAVVISGALLTFTVLAREATPPLWLAVLPVVWLIPVPFFVVSFRATQRIVAQNSLDLAGGT